jgi:hypothetical protein
MSNPTASTLGCSSKVAAASKPDIPSRAVQLPLNDSTTLPPSTRACHPWPVMDCDLRVIANPRVCALYLPRAIAPEMKAQGRRGGRRGNSTSYSTSCAWMAHPQKLHAAPAPFPAHIWADFRYAGICRSDPSESPSHFCMRALLFAAGQCHANWIACDTLLSRPEANNP